MSNLTPEQRREVFEIIGQNNPVLISSFRETMHEVIDPLKESLNRAISKYDMLGSRVDENASKIAQLFIFHNDNEEKKKNQDLKLLEITKDVERNQRDIDSIASLVRENKASDDKLEEIVRDAQTSYKTLARVGSVLIIILGVIIAILEYHK